MHKFIQIIFLGLFINLIGLMQALAGEVTLPHTFLADTTANANHVNENFLEIKTAVDDNFSLIDKYSSGYVSVSSFGFAPADDTTTSSGNLPTNNFRAITGGTLKMAAPINLVHGTELTELSVSFFSNVVDGVTINLYRYNGAYTATEIASVSCLASGRHTVTESLSHIVNLIGDNSADPAAYYLTWGQSQAGTSSIGPGIYSVRVTYTSP